MENIARIEWLAEVIRGVKFRDGVEVWSGSVKHTSRRQETSRAAA